MLSFCLGIDRAVVEGDAGAARGTPVGTAVAEALDHVGFAAALESFSATRKPPAGGVSLWK